MYEQGRPGDHKGSPLLWTSGLVKAFHVKGFATHPSRVTV